MRLFFGIQFPTEVRQALAQLSVPIPNVKWIPESNLHLTLAFLGKRTELTQKLADEAAATVRCPAFHLEIRSAGGFRTTQSASVLWAGVEPSDSLLSLRQSLVDELKDRSIFSDERPFRPHITLARVKKRSKVDARDWVQTNLSFGPVRFSVFQFHLFSSEPTPSGSIYRIVESYSLPGTDPS